MEISFARTATKHRVPREFSAHVVRNADVWVEEPPPTNGQHVSIRRLYVGSDPSGKLLEVMAVEINDGSLMIIHAMPIRLRTWNKWQSGNE